MARLIPSRVTLDGAFGHSRILSVMILLLGPARRVATPQARSRDSASGLLCSWQGRRRIRARIRAASAPAPTGRERPSFRVA